MTKRISEEEKINRAIKRFDRVKDNFFKKSTDIHNGFYRYDKSIYINSRTKIIITCPIHGDFEQYPYIHIDGSGCIKCGWKSLSDSKLSNTNEFIKRAMLIHNSFYRYDKVDYICAKTKITITCPIHGDWNTTPDSHLRGYGCYQCRNKKIGDSLRHSFEKFLERANKIHHNKYNYKFVNYINARTNIEIHCPEHGIFLKSPDCHIMRKEGCPRCSSRWKAEKEWLDYNGVPNDNDHRQVVVYLDDGSKIIADGKINNTIYEFWGTYYHGHPEYNDPDGYTYYNKKFSDLYEATQSKIEKIKNSGYDLVQIWEHDWKTNHA